MKFYLLLSIFLASSLYTLGQTTYFSQPSQRLSQNTIQVISQDQLGFLWVGTDNGLNRYDGEHFEVFFQDEQGLLEESIISALFTDMLGKLWIGTYGGGISLYDPARQKFSNEEIDPVFRKSLESSFVQCIYESKDSVVWVGTESSGLKFWDRKTGEIGQLIANGREGQSISANHVEDIVEDEDGNLWFGTFNGGLCQYNNRKDFISFFKHSGGYDLPEDDIIRRIHKGPTGKIWVGTNDGLRRLQKDENGNSQIVELGGKFAELKNLLEGVVVLSILEDSKSNIWVGTENAGLIKCQNSTGKLFQFQTDVRNNFGINSNSIWSLYEDQAGTIWVGSYKSGLCKVDPIEHRFGLVSEASGTDKSISRGLVSAFAEDSKGNLWIGTEGGGIDLMDQDHKIRNVSESELPGLKNKVIVGLIADPQDQVYAATWGEGVFIKQKNSRTFKSLESFVKVYHGPKPGKYIRTLHQNKEGNIWFASYRSGLSLFIPKTGELYSYVAGASENKISTNNVISILEDQQGTLWIGHRNKGLDKIELDEDKNIINLTNYAGPHAPADIHDNINYLFSDTKNHLWIASNGAGLYKFNPETEVAERINTSDSLPGNVIYAGLEDESGKIWVSTNNGLACLNAEKPYQIKSFDVYDGLQDKEFTMGACLRRKDGTLVFGGINGFNYFKHEEILENGHEAPFYITSLEIESFDTEKESQEVERIVFPQGEIELEHSQNDLHFSFAKLNFSQANKNLYAYKLEPLEEEWSSPNEMNFRNYLNVPPGNYVFYLRAANNDGIWNEEIVSLNIQIHHPWYWTYFARFTYLLLLAGLLIFMYQILINREKLKNELYLEQIQRNKVKELSQMKSRFFANISHEFKTPLTLIQSPLIELMQMKLLQPFKGHLDLMKKNSERLQKLIDEILDISKLESGNIELQEEYRDMSFFLRSVLDYFAQYAKKQKLELIADFPKETIRMKFDPDKMEKVLFNILSNAIKFTPPSGKINVELEKGENEIKIIVSDTGKGIKAENLPYVFDLYNSQNAPGDTSGTGIGLHLAKQYVELHKGEITVSSVENKGTVFSIHLPLTVDEDQTEILTSTGELMFAKEEAVIPLKDLKEHRLSKRPDPLQKPIILIAEDNEEIRDFLCNILKDEYRIIPCSNGAEAYEQTQLSIPDLILSDVIMPKLSGYELCKKIRENEKTCHIIFFILSVKSNERHLEEGLSYGADQYLSKPFNPKQLKLMIRNAIDKRNEFKSKLLNKQIMSRDETSLDSRSKDEDFLSNVVNIIEQNLSDSNFGVEQLCRELGYSKSQLYRKMKALLGQSANEFIRSLRLKRAAAIIEQRAFTITEVVYKVGFMDVQYFRKCFKKQFGINPSEYAKQKSVSEN
ncbi:MAG: two-component regulator propeller domain-containing protein [Bacteroidia bacterium]|nr:two-component regulator propeller domain-containing protein [Bacteroidia bacterium]